MTRIGFNAVLGFALIVGGCGTADTSDASDEQGRNARGSGQEAEGTPSVVLGQAELVDSPYVRLERVPWVGHREEWPSPAVGVEVHGLGAMSVGSWIEDLDHLRLVIRSKAHWRALWRGHRPGPAPASFPNEMLLAAGRVSDGTGGFAIDSAIMSRDTLFVVMGPHRPCPEPDEAVRLRLGIVEREIYLGRTRAYEGPLVFVEPRDCLGL